MAVDVPSLLRVLLLRVGVAWVASHRIVSVTGGDAQVMVMMSPELRAQFVADAYGNFVEAMRFMMPPKHLRTAARVRWQL